MKQTAWAHLPNAKHIDWVLASAKAHPEKWPAARAAARDAVWTAARTAAYNAVWDAARYNAWYAAYNAASDAAYYAAFDAAKGTILALIAWDDCAYMIESEVDEIKILAKLGDQRATLLLPACSVYNETKSITPLISYISKIKKCLFSI